MNRLVNFGMAVLQGKKEIVVGSKVSQPEFDVLQWICDLEDRSMSYVLRELAIRGLSQYFADGRLKTTDNEDKRIEIGVFKAKIFKKQGEEKVKVPKIPEKAK